MQIFNWRRMHQGFRLCECVNMDVVNMHAGVSILIMGGIKNILWKIRFRRSCFDSQLWEKIYNIIHANLFENDTANFLIRIFLTSYFIL